MHDVIAHYGSMELESYQKASDALDQVPILEKVSNKEIRLSLAFTVRAFRDCYADIENYEMARVMDNKLKAFCQEYNLDA